MPAPIGAYIMAVGAMAFSTLCALTLYYGISHLDPPETQRR